MPLGRFDLGFPNRACSDSTCWLGWRPAWMGKPYSIDLRERVVAAVERTYRISDRSFPQGQSLLGPQRLFLHLCKVLSRKIGRSSQTTTYHPHHPHWPEA